MEKTRAQILGENLKRIRKEKGVSRKQLSAATGITVDSIWLYETGKNLAPLDKIFVLAEVLEVSITSLTGDTRYNLEVPDVNALIFEYRFQRAMTVAEDFMDGLIGATIDENGYITVRSPAKIEYKDGIATYYHGTDAVTFKSKEDFVKVMEKAERLALHVGFNKAFRDIVFADTDSD